MKSSSDKNTTGVDVEIKEIFLCYGIKFINPIVCSNVQIKQCANEPGDIAKELYNYRVENAILLFLMQNVRRER